MGQVFRAHHALLRRPAAIKLIHDDEVSEATLRRFGQEAEATASLRSQHTVDIYDFGRRDDGSFYYVMELLDGIDLEQLVDRFGPLPANRVIHLLLQICHSLHEAHLKGLVHRDIKPANLFVCRYGAEIDFIKVLDFGLVKDLEGMKNGADANLTIGGTVLGTPASIPPEMAVGKKQIDGRADLYSLGCVAYWLLTGAMPFLADSPMEMIIKHVNEIPKPPSVSSELPIPAELNKLILSCLEKDPQARPATAADLKARLNALAVEPWTEQDARKWWDTHRPVA
jgi:serine/threonine-protein kinase